MNPRRTVNPDPRRALPSVDKLVAAVGSQHPLIPNWGITAAARELLAQARETPEAAEAGNFEERCALLAQKLCAPHPRGVLNATGVVLHTNLGRAPLAPGALEAVVAAARGYSDLELDLDSGTRGNRLGAIENKLTLLAECEAAAAVNNTAAALLLALNTLASGREVVVSRGELVEIGGSFRIPEIMRRAGVRLVEVGTTNRTHPRDYEEAIGPETALLLKVHRSNFEQRGFVREVELAELARIALRAGLPLVEDLGSGTLVDLRASGLPEESYAPARLRAGADVICFSGDKLLGGPQAGLLLGSAVHLDAMRRNPLARALRLDKLTIAALDWTLAAMLRGGAESELPVLRALLAEPAALEVRARALAARIEKVRAGLPDGPGGTTLEVRTEPDRAPVGGGSLPGLELDTWVVALRSEVGAPDFAARLRRATPALLPRVRDDAVLLDVRTLEESTHDDVEACLRDALR